MNLKKITGRLSFLHKRHKKQHLKVLNHMIATGTTPCVYLHKHHPRVFSLEDLIDLQLVRRKVKEKNRVLNISWQYEGPTEIEFSCQTGHYQRISRGMPVFQVQVNRANFKPEHLDLKKLIHFKS